MQKTQKNDVTYWPLGNVILPWSSQVARTAAKPTIRKILYSLHGSFSRIVTQKNMSNVMHGMKRCFLALVSSCLQLLEKRTSQRQQRLITTVTLEINFRKPYVNNIVDASFDVCKHWLTDQLQRSINEISSAKFHKNRTCYKLRNKISKFISF